MPELDLWKTSVSLCGAAAIGAFVFWSLYRGWLNNVHLARLTKRQLFMLFMLFLIATFVFAIFCVIAHISTTNAQARTVVAGYRAAEGQAVQGTLRSENGRLREDYLRVVDLSAKLQAALDEDREQAARFTRDVAVAIASAGCLHSDSAEVRELSSKLAGAIDRYDAGASAEEHTDEADATIRVARGILANATQKFDEALSLVGDKQIADAERSTISAYQVRADALYGLHRWREAVPLYQKSLALSADDWRLRSSLADCFGSLGEYDNALREYNIIVERLRALVEGEEHYEFSCAFLSSLNNRGTVLTRLKKYAEAFEDFDMAVRIGTKNVKENGNSESAGLACSINNRGNAHVNLGQYREGIEDFDEAIKICRKLIDGNAHADISNDLARCYHNRGLAFAGLKQYESAIADLGITIDIRTRLIQQEGGQEFVEDLVKSLLIRSWNLIRINKKQEAIVDLDRAISITKTPALKDAARRLRLECDPPATRRAT